MISEEVEKLESKRFRKIQTIFSWKRQEMKKAKTFWQEGIGKLIWTREPFSRLSHQKFIRLWESVRSRLPPPYSPMIEKRVFCDFLWVCFCLIPSWNLFLRALNTKGDQGVTVYFPWRDQWVLNLPFWRLWRQSCVRTVSSFNSLFSCTLIHKQITPDDKRLLITLVFV